MKKLSLRKFIIYFLIIIVIYISMFVILRIRSVTKKVISTNALPITNKTIILDAGHGLPEDGICLTYFLKM